MNIGTLTGAIVIEDEASNILARVGAEVEQFVKSFSGMTKTVLGSALLIVGAITGITATIIGLANAGSEVNDVTATFENFAGSAENAANTLNRMREGTLGTVTDLDLMRSSSKLLAADVKLTADQFGTLTQAAFILQNQGLGTTKEMLDLVSQALLTGRTRTLEMKLGKIDLTKAVRDHAASLNLEVKNLTPLQELEAKRIGLLDALNKRVREAGVQQRDFGEQMEFVITKVRNWGNELTSQVAKSSAVTRAVEAIGNALSETFGGVGQTAIQTIVGWVNTFADKVTYWAPIIIRWIGDIITKVQNFVAKVQQYWDTVPDWFKNIAKEAVVTAGVIYISSESIKALSGATGDAVSTGASFATMISGIRDAILSLVGAQQLWGAGIKNAITPAFTTLVPLIKQVGIFSATAMVAQSAWAAVMGSTVVTALTSLGSAIGAFLVTPLGLALVAITALVGGLRVLTGSWEFILTPMRGFWQLLKDVYTIAGDLATTLGEELRPIVNDLSDIFGTAGRIISTIFTEALRTARMEAIALWAVAKEVTPLKTMLDIIDRIHQRAETIRAFAGPGFTTGVTTVPGAAVPVGGFVPPKVTKPPPPPDGLLENIKSIRDELFGSKSIASANQYASAIGKVSNLSKLSGEQLIRVNRSRAEGMDAYGRLGKFAPKVISDLFFATQQYAEKTAVANANAAVSDMITARLARTGQEYKNKLDAATDSTARLIMVWRQGIPVAKDLGDLLQNIGEKVDIGVPDTIKFTVMEQIGQGISDIFKGLPDAFAQAFSGGGGLAHAFKAIGSQLAKAIVDPIIQKFEEVRKAAGIIMTQAKTLASGIGTAIAGLAGGAIGGTGGAAAAGIASSVGAAAAASGALGAGIAASSLAIGAVTAGIGIAAAAVFVLAKRWFGVSKEVLAARAALDSFADKLRDTLTDTQKAEAGGERWKETVIAVRDAYLLLGKTAEQAQSVVTRLWDTGNPARSKAAQQEIAINMALAQNIRSVRSLVQEYVGAGTVIPEALQRNIDQLVKMGKLTAENAAQMLNLTKTAVPSYADVTAAAERYGIQVEALGAGVQKLRITEIAEQAVIDWKLFEDAGADMNVVIAGMTTKLQDVVTTALKLGIELPKSVKPIIERMIEAGSLTDEFGEKLVDTSRLTWAETLTDKIEKLVDAMLKLVDVIDRGVGGALDNISNKVISPKIAPRYEGTEVEEPAYLAGGGRVLAFRARGTDTVPAMLTPGERVLSRSEAAGYGREQGNETVIFEVDGREFTRAVVMPNMRDNVKRYRLSRR